MFAHVLGVADTAAAVLASNPGATRICIGRTGAATGLQRVGAQLKKVGTKWVPKNKGTAAVFKYWAGIGSGILDYRTGYLALAPSGLRQQFWMELDAGICFGDSHVFSPSANVTPVGPSE